MTRREILEKARELHRYMLSRRNPRYALPRLGLALDLASLQVCGSHTVSDIDDRKSALSRIERFVANNLREGNDD